jgi:hypothetical protein
MNIDISQDPVIIKIMAELQEVRQEVGELRKAVPAYVPVEVAMSITGLSATSLWRERKKPGSVIKSKQDHGLRYERASLLVYNKTRTEVKPRGRRQS